MNVQRKWKALREILAAIAGLDPGVDRSMPLLAAVWS
jgi:hypothetical protein